MDNFSQEDAQEDVQEENETPQKPSVNNGIDDIQFDELIDIDALQTQLKKKIEQSHLGIEEPEEEDSVDIKLENELKSLPDIGKINKPVRAGRKEDSNSKKYVIYVNNENIDFMENLNPDDRRDLINKILKEQNNIAVKNKELEARKQYTINLILACITFIICFPVLFFLVNKATEATINNYTQARENFTRLYREEGKIKLGK